jgi:hypothetical protein
LDHFFDVPRLYKGGTCRAVRGERRIEDMEKHLSDHKDIVFVVYKDYHHCESDRTQEDEPFSGLGGSLFLLFMDDCRITKPVCEEINFCSGIMRNALMEVEYCFPRLVWDLSNSKMMKSPYLPLYHYRSIIEKTAMSGLSAEHQICIRLLMQYVHENLDSKFNEADALFAKDAVSKEHFSKLFRRGDIIVTFKNDQPLPYLCNGLPELDLPTFVKTDRRSE